MSSAAVPSIQVWRYPDLDRLPAPSPSPAPAATVPVPGVSEAEVLLRIQGAVRQAEQRGAAEAEAKEVQRRAQMAAALESFTQERARYFQGVEAEVVHLALAIARKVLHREAELDPTLLRALVRIALDGMDAGPAVRLRVPPAEVSAWRTSATMEGSRSLDVLADSTLQPGDCLVETDLGTANVGFDAQIKGIEEGLVALLARRPGIQ